MSQSFTGASGSGAQWDWGTTRSLPLTIAAYIKYTVHPIAIQWVAGLSLAGGSNNDSVRINPYASDDGFRATATDNAAAVSSASVGVGAAEFDGAWLPLVGVFTSTTLRDIYAKNNTTTGTSTTSRTVASNLAKLFIGRDATAGNRFAGKIAEVAIWDIALNTTQIGNYMTGTPASSIAASNLIAYFPFNTSGDTSNYGTDGGSLFSIGGNTFDSDHPTILSGTDNPFVGKFGRPLRGKI